GRYSIADRLSQVLGWQSALVIGFMIAAVDVGYQGSRALAACVLFPAWSAQAPASTHTAVVDDVKAYQPGEFWKRELPCILSVLRQLKSPPQTVVIDGYVWLDATHRAGLGAHLYEALDQQVAVVGVAKTAFRGSPHAAQVLRGKSHRPLYITAAGLPLAEAATAIRQMAGAHRLPELLKYVDQLSRSTTI
ncbi:MAG: endonuclease V, partial [Anaerolineales bacterium]|nr:endonuclease V [Anaerolineales bacterium]